MRLLCVEDEASLREDIVEYLRIRDYEVDEASTGEEAVKRLEDKEYDLVLCDIKMPRMDGYELLRQLRGDNQHIKTPFIFLSALGERDDRIRAHDTGCDGYLTKPVDFSVLDATVRAAVNRQRARDFENKNRTQCSQRHIMAAIDDALSGPISDAALTLQHLRESFAEMDKATVEGYLKHAHQDLCAHMNELHTFYSVMQLQLDRMQCVEEEKLFSDMIRDAVSEYRYFHPTCAVEVAEGAQVGPVIRADMRMLQRALGGLIASMPGVAVVGQEITCVLANGRATISVCDKADMVDAEDFVTIDASVNLAALSFATRKRLVALSYAIQVAQVHGGHLEVKLWPNDDFAMRMILPQAKA